jgi:hypothetical protein
MTLYVASQRVIPKVNLYFVMTQSGNFWIHPHMLRSHRWALVFIFAEQNSVRILIPHITCPSTSSLFTHFELHFIHFLLIFRNKFLYGKDLRITQINLTYLLYTVIYFS